jgi:hypothetical protein
MKKQKELYKTLKDQQPEIAQQIFNDVKSEINEFIDCNPTVEEDDSYLHPQVVIKSEVGDVEGLEEFEELINYPTTTDPVKRSRRSKKESFKGKNKNFLEIEKNEEHSNEIEIVCDVCGHESSFKTEMESHMMKVHSNLKKEPQTFYCEFCSRDFDKVRIEFNKSN